MSFNIKKVFHNGAEKVLKNMAEAINDIIDALNSGSIGGGHTIQDNTGTAMTQRSNLQFTGGSVTDDSTNDRTVVDIPDKTSDLTNDSGFITNTVNNLANYYLKSETYTQAQVDTLISAISTMHFEVVQTLPVSDIQTNVIYLVPSSDPGTQNIYDEYINTTGTSAGWELIGSTQVDLSDYVTTSDLATALSDYVTSTDLTTILADYVESEDLATVATTGDYDDLTNKPTIPAAQVQSDWNQSDSTAVDYIKNKPSIPTVTKTVFYGTCTGQAANQTKAVVVDSSQGFALTAGIILLVKFDANNTYSATADNPIKLNVNSTGAKNIYYGNSNAPTGTNTTAFGRANYVNQYYYDGTNWVWSGSSSDNNTTYTNMSASELTTGTATNARSISAKTLTDWITGKLSNIPISGVGELTHSVYDTNPRITMNNTFKMAEGAYLSVRFKTAMSFPAYNEQLPVATDIIIGTVTYSMVSYLNRAVTINVGDIAIIVYDGSVLKIVDVSDSGSGGHVIENSSGTDLPQEPSLQFSGGLDVQDDSTNGRTVVTATDSESLIRKTVGWTGKNLIPYPYYQNSKTENGVTFTVNTDGSVVVYTDENGATNTTSYLLHNRLNTEESEFRLKNGKYVLTGCPVGGSINGYYLGCNRTYNGANNRLAADIGSGDVATLNGDDYGVDGVNLGVYIEIKTGTIITTPLTFYPMLRTADIIDDTYEPSHDTVDKEINQIWKANGVLGAKNLISYPYKDTTKSSNGITFTDNGDGTVTVSGTASATVTFDLCTRMQGETNDIVLKNGTYILSGCPNGGSVTGYRITTAITKNGVLTSLGQDTGNGVTILANGDDYSTDTINLGLGITIGNGTVISSPITFYPMLRFADDTDDTYQPYAKTNRELTLQKVSDNPTFTEASARANIASGESFATILGKIKKWFTDLPNMFVSKSGGTFGGGITIDSHNGTASAEGYSALVVGNNIPQGTAGNARGQLFLYGNGNHWALLMPGSLTADRAFDFPDKTGTLALISDINVDGTYYSGQTGFTVSLATLCSTVLGTNKHKIYFINSSSQITDWPAKFPAVNYIFVELMNYSSVTTINIYAGASLIATGRRIGNGAITLENIGGIERYSYRGALLHGGTSTIFGYGVAQINLSGGVATIDFEVQVTTNDSSATFDYGIDRDYLTQLVGKAIAPVAGGVIHYYTSAGALDTSHEGFGGTANVAQANKYWGLSRMYTQSGTAGQWASSIFAVNSRITGRIYGTYT